MGNKSRFLMNRKKRCGLGGGANQEKRGEKKTLKNQKILMMDLLCP